ncbi:MAG: RDD family protein [Deltaproteobacteria bacterium]|nr:RDD family protein [Deltaproteobacteria bacterium]
MQSASWFVSPDDKSQDEARKHVPKGHRRVLSRRPPRAPQLDDELIAAALEEMSAGEALGASLPERPARQAPASAPLDPGHFSREAVTLPPHPASALALAPLPEALRDDVPEAEAPAEALRDDVPEAEAPAEALQPAESEDLAVTDPGLPGFAERIAHLPIPVPEREPEPVAAAEVEVEAPPSDVIPEAFRVEPAPEPPLTLDEAPRYSPPITPAPAEPRPSRFLDLEHSEPPTSSESLEAAWFAGLGERSSEEPAWAGTVMEESLADTVVRPADELPALPVPTPEPAEDREAPEHEVSAESITTPPGIGELRISSPAFDVFRRSAVLDTPRPEHDPRDSALTPASELEDEEIRPAERKIVRARVASIGARALAWLIDGAILSSTVAGLAWAAARVAGSDLGPASVLRDPLVAAGFLGLAAVVGTVYAAAGALVGGQTFGARLAKVRVLDRRGRAPGLKLALLRGFTASVGTLFFLVGLVWVVVDDRGQALHDKIAKTYVVRA